MLEELRRHREMVQGRIQKSFESDGLDVNSLIKSEGYDIEKAQENEYTEYSVTDLIKAGVLEYDDSIEKAVYADTAENRKLGRVGQEYHRGKGGSKKQESKAPNKQSNDGGYDAQKLESHKNLSDAAQKYGVKAHTNRHGEIELRIETKKEVGNLKKFLKENGINFDESKLIKQPSFHGTHSYSYDLYAGKHENSVNYYERKAKHIQMDIDYMKNNMSNKPVKFHQGIKDEIAKYEKELSDVNKKIDSLRGKTKEEKPTEKKQQNISDLVDSFSDIEGVDAKENAYRPFVFWKNWESVPYINVDINADKQQAKKIVEKINQKFNASLTIDDFEKHNSRGSSYYSITFNPSDNKFYTDRDLTDTLNENKKTEILLDKYKKNQKITREEKSFLKKRGLID